eukprot:454376-Lingulodinium_polyedra.AAC.1
MAKRPCSASGTATWRPRLAPKALGSRRRQPALGTSRSGSSTWSPPGATRSRPSRRPRAAVRGMVNSTFLRRNSVRPRTQRLYEAEQDELA